MKKIISGVFAISIINLALADAPVVDYSSDAAPSDAAQSFAMTSPELTKTASASVIKTKTRLNTEQRVGLDNDIEELRQKLQDLNGKLEIQTHKVEQLSKQLMDFYQDLNQRLGTPAKAAMPPTGAAFTPAATAVPTTTSPSSDSRIIPATAGNISGAFTAAPPKSNLNTDSAFLKEQQMYQTAIDLIADKKHESENKLREYLQQYPKGVYVANAHYWLGEINFLQKNFDAAEEEFKIVVDKHAKSKRAADAMLKLALVHQNQGREAQAKQELQKVIKRHPGTSAAHLAKQQLAVAK